MQNAGIYHIAHRGVHSINSATVFPGALPLDPAGGRPQTPIFSRFALVHLCADLPYNVLCKLHN
jgi:hypothetical protein